MLPSNNFKARDYSTYILVQMHRYINQHIQESNRYDGKTGNNVHQQELA